MEVTGPPLNRLQPRYVLFLLWTEAFCSPAHLCWRPIFLCLVFEALPWKHLRPFGRLEYRRCLAMVNPRWFLHAHVSSPKVSFFFKTFKMRVCCINLMSNLVILPPRQWRFFFHTSNIWISEKGADWHSNAVCGKKIRKTIASYDPDVVVCVHPGK